MFETIFFHKRHLESVLRHLNGHICAWNYCAAPGLAGYVSTSTRVADLGCAHAQICKNHVTGDGPYKATPLLSCCRFTPSLQLEVCIYRRLRGRKREQNEDAVCCRDAAGCR